MIVIENCQLEIDAHRGVIYVHHPEGFTALRICGLPQPIPEPNCSAMLDITLKFGGKIFSWPAATTPKQEDSDE